MKNKIQQGTTIEYMVPDGETVEGGELVIVKELPGVAVSTGTGGKKITLSVSGVFLLPKVPGGITQGERVYANQTGGKPLITAQREIFDPETNTEITHVLVGHAWNDSDGDYVEVRLL